jgi:hypothetical protein
MCAFFLGRQQRGVSEPAGEKDEWEWEGVQEREIVQVGGADKIERLNE